LAGLGNDLPALTWASARRSPVSLDRHRVAAFDAWPPGYEIDSERPDVVISCGPDLARELRCVR